MVYLDVGYCVGNAMKVQNTVSYQSCKGQLKYGNYYDSQTIVDEAIRSNIFHNSFQILCFCSV